MRTALITALTLLLFIGCATSEEKSSDPSNLMGPKINTKSTLPKKYKTQMPAEISKRPMTIAPGLLNVASVARPRAEMREGPGVHFEIVDLMVKKGDEVLVFDRVGVWQKVILLNSWKRGWVHNQVLSKTNPNKKTINTTVGILPTVFAQHPIRTVYSFPKHNKIKTMIPTGAIFKSLKHSLRRTLVWQADTNSIMWLSQKDVR